MIKDNIRYYKVLFVKFRDQIDFWTNIILFLVSLASVFALIMHLGYPLNAEEEIKVSNIAYLFLLIFLVSSTLRFIFYFRDVLKERLLILDLFFYVFNFMVIITIAFIPDHIQKERMLFHFFSHTTVAFTLMTILAIVRISKFVFGMLSSKINPSLLFIYSFLFFILLGTGLLMLPNCTVRSISFVDALFTSTTSVCVTGLCTIDIPSTFTLTGQLIILMLIQIGGIGVMTFTSFFALSFSGSSSFSGVILLRDFLNENHLGNMFRTLLKILGVAFGIELLGAYCIWYSIHGTLNWTLSKEIYVSVFHAISAFCNAGISVLDGNLTNEAVNRNYNFIFFISILIILGGIGFPIVFNYIKLFRHYLINFFRILFKKQEGYIYQGRIINTHTKVVIITTLVLILMGSISIFFFEQYHAHAGMGIKGQLISSFFEAVTPRTAGFNALSMGSFSRSTIAITFVLMLIGAAPMSTAGGMKVSTIYIAIQAAFDTARGKRKMEIRGREIDSKVTSKASAVIILYLLWLFIATIILSVTEAEATINQLLFEVASALSTVGLSLDFTPSLTSAGKYVIIATMFVGRVGTLTFLMGILKRYKQKTYSYPQANVIIG